MKAGYGNILATGLDHNFDRSCQAFFMGPTGEILLNILASHPYTFYTSRSL